MRGLAGRGVLVSGGTSGIGLAAALRFLEEGCRVFIVGHSSEELARALELLGERDGLAGGTVFDVRDNGCRDCRSGVWRRLGARQQRGHRANLTFPRRRCG